MRLDFRYLTPPLLLILGGVIHLLSEPTPPGEGDGPQLSALLGGKAEAGFERAIVPITFQFPRDHGPHPAFKHEWWYVTGNLASETGAADEKYHFGYQLTLFRIALTPSPVERTSSWATSQVYMGHLALSDINGKKFHHFQRFSRGAAGLAGAEAEPFRVWLDDWEISGAGGQAETPRLRVHGRQGGIGIQLTLTALKPVVLQGENGLSRKNAEAGNASYYYSLPRLESHGAVTRDGKSLPVRGLSWLDREWSTSALAEDQEGWDWFALHLSDGWDLMYYRMRRRDQTADPLSRGVLIDPKGTATQIVGGFDIQTLDHWTSPKTGVTYPSGWRLNAPEHGLSVTVAPRLADQELDRAAVRYWEGAVSITGSHRGRPISGQGYTELAGYGATRR